MSDDKRIESYKQLHTKYNDLVWKPWLKPLAKVLYPLMRRGIDIQVEVEGNIPTDGSIFFPQNHSNFYDSLVLDKVLNDEQYFCFASDEPRGKATGLSFEYRGVMWLDRDSEDSGRISKNVLADLAKSGENISWCPEGTWNLSDNKLMLNLAYGMSKSAIEASKYNKVYIVPLVYDYDYEYNKDILGKEHFKIKKANVKICKALEVTPDMDYKELNEIITNLFWTERWYQLERKGVYNRDSVSLDEWKKLIEDLKKQYKGANWSREENSVVKTPKEKEQEQVRNDLSQPSVILKQPVYRKVRTMK